MAETSYTISGDASGGFNFEFVDPETPDGGSGSALRDHNNATVFADWIGTKLLIVDCVEDGDCDDGIACTGDSCVDNVCVNAPDDGACDDGNGCTDDVCNPASGCENTNVSDGTACDDGGDTDCDNPDSCLAGVCEDNNEPDGTACPDDGDPCTDDVCEGKVCEHINVCGACCEDDDCSVTGEKECAGDFQGIGTQCTDAVAGA